MKRLLLHSLLLACLCAACGAQSGKLSFEVASIKPSEPQPMNQIRIGMNADAGMLRYTNVALKDIVRVAYRVKDFQVEGPDWMGSARFDIVAKFPAGATQDDVPEMLQDMLAERFRLTIHHDSKEHAIFALIPGKDGPKLKAAEVQTRQDAPTPGAAPRPGGGTPRGALMFMMDPSGMHLKAPAVTLANLCDAISRFTERPVLDMTNIQGQYEFDLVFMPETTHGMPRMMGPPPAVAGVDHSSDGSAPSEPGASIYEAVQRYGLKLEPRKAPMDMIVIDHIEKTPTEN
jgi:uncharacterized protein (TIGR03435 family)